MYEKNGVLYTEQQVRANHPSVSFCSTTFEELGYSFTPVIEPVTEAMKKYAVAAAVERHLNDKALEHRYKDYHAAMAYVGSPVAKFNNEAVAFRDWVSQVWAHIDQLEQDVANNVRPEPASIDEVISGLPQFTI